MRFLFRFWRLDDSMGGLITKMANKLQCVTIYILLVFGGYIEKLGKHFLNMGGYARLRNAIVQIFV